MTVEILCRVCKVTADVLTATRKAMTALNICILCPSITNEQSPEMTEFVIICQWISIQDLFLFNLEIYIYIFYYYQKYSEMQNRLHEFVLNTKQLNINNNN